MITKTCPVCETDFTTYPSIDKTCCSRECSQKRKQLLQWERYKQVCENCGEEFLPARPAEGGRFCSYKCRGEACRGRVERSGGYWALYLPDNPLANKQGYVLEHRYVAAEEWGYDQVTCEVDVHHLNGNKKDNRVENLEILCRKKHRSYHATQSERSDNGRFE